MIIILLHECILINLYAYHSSHPCHLFLADMKKQGFGEESELIMLFPDPGQQFLNLLVFIVRICVYLHAAL